MRHFLSRRLLVVTGMAASLGALLTFAATPAAALVIPPLSASAAVADGAFGGNCYANLLEFTNTATQDTATYELRGNTTGGGLGVTMHIDCWLPGGSTTFYAPATPDANSYALGEAQITMPITATHVTECISVTATITSPAPFPPETTSMSNCS